MLPAEIVNFFQSDDGLALQEDVAVWSKHYSKSISLNGNISEVEALAKIFHYYSEFRSLFDYRLQTSGRFASSFKFAPDLRRANDLNFNLKSLGGGAFVQHGSNTWLFARSIGKNFFVNHNVTVGQGKGGAPTIGDNVVIRTGAVVVGAIKVGSNVHIGANSVVNFDVPDGARVYAPRSVMVISQDYKNEIK